MFILKSEIKNKIFELNFNGFEVVHFFYYNVVKKTIYTKWIDNLEIILTYYSIVSCAFYKRMW